MGRTVEVEGARALSATVRELSLRCVDGAPVGHVAGQWLDFDVPVDASVVRRAYSIASAPDRAAPDRFEIAVTRVAGGGGASQRLHALAVGGRLQVDGPHGFFTRERERDDSALFVATGTGLCPLRAMLQEELSRSEGPPLGLLFGCRTQADILWRDDLEAWAAAHPRLRVWITLSRGEPSWSGLRGYVQTHLGEALSALGRPHVFVCGLSKMVGDVRAVLKQAHGYDRKLIHSERYD
jgi:ferredoxin-NADP reductase